ncbi:hypothetical protein DAI21_22840 (plasmid) [Lelliottia sp. WB101]|nr:hypothetical protein DAI21_22840 [Lelliottia sp. WB101]
MPWKVQYPPLRPLLLLPCNISAGRRG